MNLATAFEIFHSRSALKTNRELALTPAYPENPHSPELEYAITEELYQQATRLIYEELKSHIGLIIHIFKVNHDEAEDIVHETYLALLRRANSLTTPTDAAARSYLKRALVNIGKDHKRKCNPDDKYLDRTHELSEMGERGHLPPFDDVLLEMREFQQDSTIIVDGISPDKYEDAIYTYIADQLLPHLCSDSKLEAEQQIIEELRQITSKNITYDDLVDQHLQTQTEPATKQERRLARNRIQQAHSRTRKLLQTWLDEQAHEFIVESPSQEREITPFDYQLLLSAVENLRSRRKKS